MGRGFDGEAEQNQGDLREAMMAMRRRIGVGFGFLDGETQNHRQVRDRTRGQFLFVEREKMGDVAERDYVLQAKFGDRFCQGASEARCLSDGGEVWQSVRGNGGVYNVCGESFHAES